MKKIIVTGNLAADATNGVRTNGKGYMTFRMANNDDKDSEGNRITSWFTVFTDEKMLALKPYLTKGKPVIVIGRYTDRLYFNNMTNSNEIGRTINAESIEFVSGFNGENRPNNSVNNNVTVEHTATPKITIPAPKAPVQSVDMSNHTDDDDDLPF